MDANSRSADPAAVEMLERAQELGASTAWDRQETLKRCRFGSEGTCCQVCFLGPCRIGPSSEVGVCGAEADLIVARNFARSVATGTAAHSDHAREIARVLQSFGEHGAGSGYQISDPEKLSRLAEEWGIDAQDHSPQELSLALGQAMSAEFGSQEGPLRTLERAPAEQRERWAKLGVVPRGIDREVVELVHRTHHGVESDPVAMLRAALRTALADGWGGSMIATDASDVLFGTPVAVRSRANLGVLDPEQVNILVHGHEPVLSETIVRVCRDQDLVDLARAAGAEGINIAGICCTANEILMRQGMPVAGNYLHQELALLTGAVDAMVVDVQCVMPSLPQIASCHHTAVISTSPKASIPAAVRVPFDAAEPLSAAREVVEVAIEAFKRRDPDRVQVPTESSDLVAGFTTENLRRYMGGRLRGGYRPLNDAIAAGRIRGVVGLVGCNNTRFVQDAHHIGLARELLAKDVLLVKTGCSAIASAKFGLMNPSHALEYCGPGLREVCEAVGIPPVLHMGSCVDNSRILTACVEMVAEGGIGEDLSQLPVAAAAPEAMSEKAITIGLYAVASGIFTVFMPIPRVGGSDTVRRYLEEEIEEETGGKFFFTEEVEQAAARIVDHLNAKRQALKLAPMIYEDGIKVGDAAASRDPTVYEAPKGVEALGCGKAQSQSQSRPPSS